MNIQNDNQDRNVELRHEALKQKNEAVEISSSANIYFESENFSSQGNNLVEDVKSSKTVQIGMVKEISPNEFIGDERNPEVLLRSVECARVPDLDTNLLGQVPMNK